MKINAGFGGVGIGAAFSESMSRPLVLNVVKDAVSVPLHSASPMKWLIRNKETGLYLKNLWTWTQKPVEAHVFPNGLSLVQFCLRHKVPPMDMIPLVPGISGRNGR